MHGELETLNKFKKEIKNGSVMPVHAERAKRTFNMLALLTKKLQNIFFWTPLLQYNLFFHFY